MTTQRAILETLNSCDPYTMPETTIFSDVRLRVSPPPGLTEIRKELVELEAKRQIVSTKDEDKGTVYGLTAEGKARLAR